MSSLVPVGQRNEYLAWWIRTRLETLSEASDLAGLTGLFEQAEQENRRLAAPLPDPEFRGLWRGLVGAEARRRMPSGEPLEISVYRADGIFDGRPRPLVIRAVEPFPCRTDLDEGDLRGAFAKDAARLVDALFGSLPGGTLDRLVVEVLRHRLGSYIGRLESRDETATELLRGLVAAIETPREGGRGAEIENAIAIAKRFLRGK